MSASIEFSTPRFRRPLWTLYLTSLVSVTGDAMAAIAIPWFVLQTTGSAVQMGITAFFSVTPIVIGMFFGGVLVDRIGYKRASVAADLASGGTMLLIPILHYTVGLSFPVLLALVFLGNLLDAPGSSARRSMLPELAAAARMDIDRASGLSEAISRATTMIGAPLAGVLIAVFGAPVVLLLDALTFLISAAGIGLLIPSRLIVREAPSGASYAEDLRAGFHFVKENTLLRLFVVVVMTTNMIDGAMGGVTLPYYAEQVFGKQDGSTTLGVIIGVFAGFALLGSVVYSFVGRRFSRRILFGTAFVLAGLRFILFALIPPLGVLLVALAGIGFTVGWLNPIISAVLYEQTPKTMRARVFGLISAGVLVAMPLGGLIGGFLLERVGFQLALWLYAPFYIMAGASILVIPAARQMDADRLAAAAPAMEADAA